MPGTIKLTNTTWKLFDFSTQARNQGVALGRKIEGGEAAASSSTDQLPIKKFEYNIFNQH